MRMRNFQDNIIALKVQITIALFHVVSESDDSPKQNL